MKDIQYAFRTLRTQPGFAALALLCLVLGIGATTAVFSWVEGILLKPFPLVASQDRLVAITGFDQDGNTDISWPDFLDFRRNGNLAETFIAEHIFRTTLNIGARAERATAGVVSANYFEALGIHPILGRTFSPSDDTGRKAHAVAVISYQCWKDRYGGDPEIIGKTQTLNGVAHTIIGVAPRGFYGTFVGYSFQFWVPASMEELFEAGGYKLEDRGARWIEGFELLKPGVRIEQARSEISAIAKRLERDYPATNRGIGVRLYPLWQTPFNGAGTLLPTLRTSVVVAGLVLLIACANVGNLLLFRSLKRRHEMSVRLALGAGQRRLLKQLLTEALVLAGVAAVGGLALAYAARDLIKLLFPVSPGVIVNLPAQIDWRVLALSCAVCLASALLFAFAPALQTTDINLASAMKSDSGAAIGGRAKTWVRGALVVVQVSLSFLLLIAAGLLLRSTQAMQHADPGFATDKVLTTSLDLTAAGYDNSRVKSFESRLLDRLQGLGGVESAAFARVSPITYKPYSSARITIEGFEALNGEQPEIDYDEVGPQFLNTLGISLISGREFTVADKETARLVGVVNETMAQRMWRGENPLGKRFQAKGKWIYVVGVAANSKYENLLEPPKAFFYVPMLQSAMGQTLQIRTSLPASAVAKSLTREIKALDSNLTPTEVITMREQVNRMNWSKRAAAGLLMLFTAIALLLAAIGLYGLMSYNVAQSGRDLALRMALGADRSALLWLVIRRGLNLTGAGVLVGGATAFAVMRLLGYLLYKVSPYDPATLGAALLVMIAVAFTACLVPAIRAVETDPVRGLRN